MFVKLTSGLERVMLISRNLILQGFLKSGSKSCKPEVTFAIHLTMHLVKWYIYIIAHLECIFNA